eukprot:SAG31_NODE_13008_length_900_cov_1.052434_1_plen_59_part_10
MPVHPPVHRLVIQWSGDATKRHHITVLPIHVINAVRQVAAFVGYVFNAATIIAALVALS